VKFALGLLAAALATPTSAQVIEGEAMRPQADAMRKAWRASPAKPVAITVPLFGRVMRLDMLRNFVPAYQAQNGTNFIFEFLPDGQNFDSWTQMVTVTAVRGGGAARVADPDLASGIFNTPRGCESGHFYRPLGRRDMGDGVSAIMLSKGCAMTAANAYPGATGRKGEQSLIMHFRDAQNIYSLQYAVRGVFAGGQPIIPDARVAAELQRFGAVSLKRQ
jgi:hypothetical protein